MIESESVAESSPGLLLRLRQFFLLEQRLALARRAGFGAGDPGWCEFVLARAALADAQQLAYSVESVGSALLLYRSALLLLVQARRARPAEPLAASIGSEPSILLPPIAALLEALPAEQRSLLERALEPSAGEAHLARLSQAQQQLAGTGMLTVARALIEPLEAQVDRVRRVLRTRGLRIAVAACVTLICIVWLGVKLVSRPNLALNKDVVASNAWKVSRVPAAQLVDGNRENLGFHTQDLPNQSVTIDLGHVTQIHEVRVYNRADCCQERALPLRLELSTDGVQYSAIDRRTQPFSVWTVGVPNAAARFVRLVREDGSFFHLSEVEVY